MFDIDWRIRKIGFWWNNKFCFDFFCLMCKNLFMFDLLLVIINNNKKGIYYIFVLLCKSYMIKIKYVKKVL